MKRLTVSVFVGLLITAALSARSPISALTISPSVVDLSVESGGVTNVDVSVINDESVDYTVELSLSDIKFTRSGIPQFSDDLSTGSEEGSDPSNAASWITLPFSTQQLPAGGELTLSAQINVPVGTSPGGYYAAVLIKRKPTIQAESEDEFSAKVEARGAALVYITVKGDVKGAYAVTEVAPLKKVYYSLPVEFSFTLSNEGNVHLQPHGLITITNVLTDKKEADILFNEDSTYLMPTTERSFGVVWDKGQSDLTRIRFGKYRADVAITAQYGNVYNTQMTFWIIPVPQMLAVGVVLLILFIGLVIFRKRLMLKAKKA